MDSLNGGAPSLESDNNERQPLPPTGSKGPSVASGDDDIVSLYLKYTKDAPTPERYRLWTAIHAIGAAGERRIWTQLGINKLHPNLFIFLVGPPGTGKSQAINPMVGILRKSQSVGLAPTDMSKQGLLDALAENEKGVMMHEVDGTPRPFDYHFMTICISELSNFMSQYDHALAGLLTDLFDCGPMIEEKKRHGNGKTIPFPGISFIMGTATENLGKTISADMWGSGFMARVIMVFSAEEIIPEDMFEVRKNDDALADEIANRLRTIGEFKGPMYWEPDARELLKNFRINQKEGAPLHNLLTTYVTRRWLHLGKLCMIAALSDERMTVCKEDVERAIEWLLDAEGEMTEIFKDMNPHEDGQIFEDLRGQMWAIYMRAREPLPHVWLMRFFSKRISAYSVPRMLEVAEAAGFISRVAGTSGDTALYIPSPPFGEIDKGRV